MGAPDVRCLVGWQLDDGGLIIRRDLVLLADAATYHAYGWIVLVDPDDLEALAAYERSQQPWNRPRMKGQGNGD